jgi:hypothetical protein
MSYITVELHDLKVGNRYFIFNKFMEMKVVKNLNPLFATFKEINKETNIPVFTDILEVGCPDFTAEYSSEFYQICIKKEIIITI